MTSKSVESAINKLKFKGTVQRILGWIITAFNCFIALIGCVASGFEDSIDVVIILFFSTVAIIGVWVIIKGNQKFKLINTFYHYSSRLAVDPEKSIDLLASTTGVTVATATKNIINMLEVGFFPNCYLDGQRNKLVFPSTQQSQSPIVTTFTTNMQNQGVKYTTAQCKSCGATNKIIIGTVAECEFCGSKILG